MSMFFLNTLGEKPTIMAPFRVEVAVWMLTKEL